MKTTNNTLLMVAASIIVLLMIIAFLQHDIINKYKNDDNTKDSTVAVTTEYDTLWKDTTIIERQLVPTYVIKIKRDTLFSKDGDTIQLERESKRFDKTLTVDKDTADLQIYTSGIETSLDSLKMALKTHTDVITNTVTVTKYIEKPKTIWNRIHIQPQVTSGYDLINKQWGVTVGIGVGVDF